MNLTNWFIIVHTQYILHVACSTIYHYHACQLWIMLCLSWTMVELIMTQKSMEYECMTAAAWTSYYLACATVITHISCCVACKFYIFTLWLDLILLLNIHVTVSRIAILGILLLKCMYRLYKKLLKLTINLGVLSIVCLVWFQLVSVCFVWLFFLYI